MPLRFVSTAFLAIVALAVSECAQIVGVLLVFTLMVGPPAAAQRVTTGLWSGLLLSAVLALAKPGSALTMAYLHRLAGQLLHRHAQRARLFRLPRPWQDARMYTARVTHADPGPLQTQMASPKRRRTTPCSPHRARQWLHLHALLGQIFHRARMPRDRRIVLHLIFRSKFFASPCTATRSAFLSKMVLTML